MKKLLLTLSILVLAVGVAQADAVKFDLPDINVKEGMIISLEKEGVENVLTTTLLSYDTGYGRLDLDVGAAPTINEPIAAVAYHIGDLKNLGIDAPLAKYIDLSVGAYIGFETNKYDNAIGDDDDWRECLDYGVYTTILHAKF